MDPLKRYAPGESFAPTAAQLNAWTDAALHTQGNQSESKTPPLLIPRSTTVASIKNDSGSNVPRFGVLGISGVVVEPTNTTQEKEFVNNFVLVGETPDTDEHSSGQVAILLEPLASGKIGKCLVVGLTPVMLDLPDGETYDTATIITGQVDRLDPEGSIAILWHETGPGVKWALANLGAGGGGPCPLIHEFYIDGGNPTTGSQVWSYTIDGDTQDVTINHDDDSADIKAAFVAAFSGVTTDDIDSLGGQLPNRACYIGFGSLNVTWHPGEGTNSLDDGAAMKIRKSGGA